MRAEAVFVDGKVHTGSKKAGFQEAFSVAGGKFLRVGSTEEILRDKGPSTSVHKLNKRTVLPGLTDAHAHFQALGHLDTILNLAGTPTAEAVIALVAERAKKAKKDEWIVGRGWDNNDWEGRPLPTREMLDRAAPDNPVFLRRVDGHAAWINSKAVRLAGITAETPDPEGGRILNEGGILVDRAMGLVRDVLPKPDRRTKKESVRRAAQKCLAVGLTMVHDMGLEAETLGIIEELVNEDALPFRLYATIEWKSDDREKLMAAGPRIAWKDRLWLRGVKIYADGALGSRGAAMLEPFDDDPGNTGLMNEELRASILATVERGFQPVVHAIGDRAARILLDIFEEVVKKHGRDVRPRMEHAQILHPQDLPRFAAAGVIASMQPIHATADMGWADDRLGVERARFSYAAGRLLRSGATVASGSDFPIESENPFWGIHAAVTRQDHDGNPQGGWHPKNRITLEEAIESFTLAPARAAFMEDVYGTIEPGKYADFVVLDRDIFDIPPVDLYKVRPDMTVVGGTVAYQRG
ncbi:MAG: amidohydrolase [Planctomycetota bacterium]|jgi:predicted amidohydrolase YtcJ